MDTPEMIAAEYLRRNVTIDIGRAVSRGWELVMANLPVLVGATVLAWAISIGLGVIPFVQFFSILVMGPIHAGLLYMFLQRIRGRDVQVGDLFIGFNVAPVPLMIATVLVAALTAVGFILCIVPGVYLTVGYLFVLPLILDKKLDFWPAMEVSRQVVHKQWWSMFLFALVLVLILCAGALLCGVGLIIAVPLVMAALMYVYEDLFGTADSGTVSVTPPPPGTGAVTV
jgi:uncharacterized membrane protein